MTRKKITDLSIRSQRYQRKYWRKKQAECRLRKASYVAETTLSQSDSNSPVSFSANKMRGREKVCRSKSKVVRENLKLQKCNEKLQLEMYKKRCQRLNIKQNKNISEEAEKQSTPRTKTMATMRKYFKGKLTPDHPVARQLFLHNIIKQSLQNKYKTMSKEKKRLFQEVLIANKLVKKYRLLRQGLSYIGVSNRTLRHKSNKKSLASKRRIITKFFNRDDISRATAGKKETVTKKKKKRQKRFLTDTMKNLYKIFCLENSRFLASYTTFTRFRPFYVVAPRAEGNFEQIVAILPQPELILRRNRVLYEFPISLNTYEK